MAFMTLFDRTALDRQEMGARERWGKTRSKVPQAGIEPIPAAEDSWTLYMGWAFIQLSYHYTLTYYIL